MSTPYEEVYHVGLLDDIHNFFPAILYHSSRFATFQDCMTYVREQMNHHFNTFNRARRMYHTQHGIAEPNRAPIATATQRPRIAVGLTTETIDLTHLFTTGGGLGARTPGGDLEEFPIGFVPGTGAAGGGGILEQITNLLTRATEPVIVAPTTQEIDRATSLRVPYSTEDAEHTTCTICQESLMDEHSIRPVREITHCEHAFHQTCIDRWFTRNVRCPVCRFDIREHETPVNSP